MTNYQVAVVMVPFPAQGHLNQLLQLSRLISSYNIPVHYVSTAAHNRQAKLRVHGWNNLVAVPNIHFHELQTLDFHSPDPDPYNSVKFPSHLQPLFDASLHLREPVRSLLTMLSATSRRVIIVHDSLMGSVVQDIADFPDAESYTFHSISAYGVFFFLWETLGRPFPIDDEMLRDLPSLEGCFSSEFVEFVKYQHGFMSRNSGRIYNTCRMMEGQFLDLLEKTEISKNKKQWALGPFNPVAVSKKGGNGQIHESLYNWLDMQGPNTVLFISFGTTTSFSDAQVKMLANGLEKSEQKFIWVLREADKGDIFAGKARDFELPEGFENRVEGRGIIIRDWAPQLDILAHPATGGFMSHCGWNSCMESITMGVPIGAWPMHSDQPRNTVLITKILKVGIVVRDWARRDHVVTASAVESAVRRLMASEEGKEIRKTAADLGDAVRRSVAEGGVAQKELDSFIAHITR